MTFYTILWLIILVFTLGLQAELLSSMLPVFDLRSLTLRQVVPVSYQTTLGLFQGCNKCYTKHIHPHNTLTSKYIPNFVSTRPFSHLNNNSTPRPSPSTKSSFRRVYDADAAYVDLKSYGAGRFKTATQPKPKSKMTQNVGLDDNSSLKKKFLQQMHTLAKNYVSEKNNMDTSNESLELINKTVKTEHGNAKNLKGKVFENDLDVYDTQNKDSEESKGESAEDGIFVEETPFDALENITAMKVDDSGVKDNIHKRFFPFQDFDHFENKLLATNFDKFTSMSASRGDSGMSFVQSGLFLGIVLMALSTEVDIDTKNEIDLNLRLNVSDQVKIKLIKQVISSLPESTEELSFRWASRLVLHPTRHLTEEFLEGAARALHLKVDRFEGTETTEAMALALNKMIEADSGGSIRDTFEEDDLTQDEEAVLITTLYFRARWRSSPTLLNGTRPFWDSGDFPRPVRMININDVMNYVDLPEWDAEAIEISYSTKGLSLLMLIPRGNSLKGLVEHVTNASTISTVTDRMQNIRIAVALPLYTLRMTLLLPNKLQAMGMSRLVDANRSEVGGSLRLSQAVQRIMFWAEAGRNAYKDDGLEWDEPPDMKMMVDRPYMFFVRWQNMTLMNGNFVL